jgi:hypothetical protein
VDILPVNSKQNTQSQLQLLRSEKNRFVICICYFIHTFHKLILRVKEANVQNSIVSDGKDNQQDKYFEGKTESESFYGWGFAANQLNLARRSLRPTTRDSNI